MNPQDKEHLKEQYIEMRIRNRLYPTRKPIATEPENEELKSITHPKNQTE